MPDAGDFDSLMQQVREGSEAAARELVAVYGEHILRVIRRQLNPRLRTKFDSQDFVQAVWASFFAVAPDRCEFGRPQDLAVFLARMAENKVVDVVRQRLQTQRHDVKRETPLDDGQNNFADCLAARQPTAEEVAVAREEWERLLRDQPEEHRRVLDLLRRGYGRGEVARELSLNARTMYRILRRIEKAHHEPR
jgi:RNA polymerase sigma factor (sigma-70 family)